MDPDITLDDKRYIRLPAYLLWGLLAGWSGAVWSYLDLRNTVLTTQKLSENTAAYQKADHNTLGDMNNTLMRVTITLDDFKNTYDRDFNRYIRDQVKR